MMKKKDVCFPVATYLDPVRQLDKFAPFLSKLLNVVAGRRVVRKAQHPAVKDQEQNEEKQVIQTT